MKNLSVTNDQLAFPLRVRESSAPSHTSLRVRNSSAPSHTSGNGPTDHREQGRENLCVRALSLHGVYTHVNLLS